MHFKLNISMDDPAFKHPTELPTILRQVAAHLDRNPVGSSTFDTFEQVWDSDGVVMVGCYYTESES